MTQPLFVDSHAHLQDEKFREDLDEVIREALESGIEKILAPGTDLKDSKTGTELAEKYDSVYAAVGIHPHLAANIEPDSIEKIEDLLKRQKVIAIGEIGLDYYYDFAPREKQKELFIKQIELALTATLPMIIHSRSSLDDIFEILDDTDGWKAGGVFHCFPGELNQATHIIEKGMHVSYTGIITFKKANRLRSIVREIPIEKLLIETDCPYMAPEPYRGKRNNPSLVKRVAETIAELKEMKTEEVGRITTDNFNRLFNL
jgi:TatD DNase family protein